MATQFCELTKNHGIVQNVSYISIKPEKGKIKIRHKTFSKILHLSHIWGKQHSNCVF